MKCPVHVRGTTCGMQNGLQPGHSYAIVVTHETSNTLRRATYRILVRQTLAN